MSPKVHKEVTQLEAFSKHFRVRSLGHCARHQRGTGGFFFEGLGVAGAPPSLCLFLLFMFDLTTGTPKLGTALDKGLKLLIIFRMLA